ncbi:MAG: type II and III secretion system protein family protein [Methylotetracoccus sp.]
MRGRAMLSCMRVRCASWLLWAMACAMSLSMDVALGAVSVSGIIDSQRFEIPLRKAVTVDVGQDVARISMADPAVAEMILLRPRQVLVHGNRLGTTNVLLWNAANQVFAVLDIEVVYDLDILKEKLHAALPGERIEVQVANQRIILKGQVSSIVNMDAALKIAASYVNYGQSGGGGGGGGGMPQGAGGGAGGVTAGVGGQGSVEWSPNVINLLTVTGAQQVTLAVRVAEVNRTLLKRMDVRFRSFGRTGDFAAGVVGQGGGLVGSALTRGLPLTLSTITGGGFFSFANGNVLVDAVLDVAKNQNLLKILAEPNLTALSGQKASFLSGGEFPVPVSQGGQQANAVTVDFKPFGVGVDFVPIVVDPQRINLQTSVNVSEISSDSSVNLQVPGTESAFVIPSLTLRKAATTLELNDGQTMSIAGLISDRTREASTRFPWLGDIPVLGALFRSQDFQNNQTELVIFVTPHLTRPIQPRDVRLPIDDFVEPDDIEFYLMGKMDGTVRRGTSLRRFMETLGTGAPKGGLDGSVGLEIRDERLDEED